MIDPLHPHRPPPLQGRRERWADEEQGSHPKGVAAKGGRALPGNVQSGTRWGALISRADETGEAAHTMHTCGQTEQVKSGANAMNQELNACQTSCLTQGAMRRADGLDPTRPRSARVGPAGAVQFVTNALDVGATAPVGPCRPVRDPQVRKRSLRATH